MGLHDFSSSDFLTLIIKAVDSPSSCFLSSCDLKCFIVTSPSKGLIYFVTVLFTFRFFFCISAHAGPLSVSMALATHWWSLLCSEFPLCSCKAKPHLRVSFLLGDFPFCSRFQQVASFLAASQCQEIKLSLSVSPLSGQGKTVTTPALMSPHHVQEELWASPARVPPGPFVFLNFMVLAHRCSGAWFILQWSQSRVLKWRQSKICSRCSVPSNSGRWTLLTVSLRGGQAPSIARHMGNWRQHWEGQPGPNISSLVILLKAGHTPDECLLTKPLHSVPIDLPSLIGKWPCY